MSNQRTSFAKRQREQNRKDKARAKQERLASRRGATGTGEKGPPIAWDEPAGADATTDATTDAPPAPPSDDVPTDG
jgi:hypothetical protein